MKLVLSDLFTNEIEEFLLTQNGISEVTTNIENGVTILNIEFNEEMTPMMILCLIEMF